MLMRRVALPCVAIMAWSAPCAALAVNARPIIAVRALPLRPVRAAGTALAPVIPWAAAAAGALPPQAARRDAAEASARGALPVAAAAGSRGAGPTDTRSDGWGLIFDGRLIAKAPTDARMPEYSRFETFRDSIARLTGEAAVRKAKEEAPQLFKELRLWRGRDPYADVWGAIVDAARARDDSLRMPRAVGDSLERLGAFTPLEASDAGHSVSAWRLTGPKGLLGPVLVVFGPNSVADLAAVLIPGPRAQQSLGELLGNARRHGIMEAVRRMVRDERGTAALEVKRGYIRYFETGLHAAANPRGPDRDSLNVLAAVWTARVRERFPHPKDAPPWWRRLLPLSSPTR